MNWTDKDIDNLYKTKASNSSFEYKDSYWKEMEAMLPKNSGKDLLWMVTAFISLGLVTISLLNPNLINTNTTLITKNTTYNTPNKIQETNPIEQNITVTTRREENTIQIQEANQNNDKRDQRIANDHSSKDAQYSVSKSNKKTEDETSSSGLNNERYVSAEDKFNTLATTKNHAVIKKNVVKAEEISAKLLLKEITLLPQEETDLLISPNPVVSPIRKHFYIQVIGGTSQSMVIPSNVPSYNIGTGIGLQINKGRFVFNTGINGIWSHHNNLLLTRQAKIYSFGSDFVQYEIKYKELFSLEADLSIGYQFSKHIIRIGVRPSYILGTKAGYREQTATDETSNNYYGITQGLNLFGIKPMVGYTYLMKRDLSIGFNIGMQLTPLINENFISGMNRNLPIDGQIYIRKTIHFRK